MSWGVIDNNASKPAYLSADSNAPQGDQRDNCFGVDADEVAAATDDGKGGISQGFVAKRTKTRYTEGTSTAVTHSYYEPLVCVNITSGDLEDDDFPDS